MSHNERRDIVIGFIVILVGISCIISGFVILKKKQQKATSNKEKSKNLFIFMGELLTGWSASIYSKEALSIYIGLALVVGGIVLSI